MVISLNWPEEYLISISGTLRDDIKDIESLSFYTNQTIYGPFGVMEGLQQFSSLYLFMIFVFYIFVYCDITQLA